MNILYIAYSCSPYHGSEDKIGWNVPVECAKKHNVFVITKEEQRPYIEKYLQNHPVQNLKFFYVDIPGVYKKLFNGPMYSGRLNIWNRRAFVLAKEICKNEQIDVIHQITPIEFRSIGDYGKIPGVKFVCGPIGGGEYIPKALECYGRRQAFTETVRAIANSWYRLCFRLNKKLSQVDQLIFANEETLAYLKDLLLQDQNYDIKTEIGLSTEELIDVRPISPKRECRVLVAGRLVYRKGHQLLFDAIKELPENVQVVCRIVGDGPERARLQALCQENAKLRNCVEFAGPVNYNQMVLEYERADVLVMPSLRETTGTVLLEAMSKGVPVITIGQFGGAILLDNETGWLYTGTDKESYINHLSSAILECIHNPEEVERRGRNARIAAENHTWEKKVQRYLGIYSRLTLDGEKEEN